jgi:hypothetical protein
MSDEKDQKLDQLAVLRAEIDQMAALAPELARVAHAWFDAFKEAGFDDKQALYLAASQVLQNPGTAPS